MFLFLIAFVAAEPLTLKGHTGWVSGVAFSPDGKVLASSSADGTVRFWNPTTGKELATLDAHADAVTAVAFSPDGKRFATSSFDGTAKVWETKSRELRHTVPGHRGAVQTVAFDPRDERLVTTGGIDGAVSVWNFVEGKEWAADGHRSWVNAVAYSPTSLSQYVTVSSDNTISFRSPGTATERFRVHPRAAELRCVCYSPDGKWVAVGTRYGPVVVFETGAGKEVARLKGHTADVWAVAFSRDSETLASGNGDWDRPGEIRLWDTATWTEKAKLKHSGEVLCLAFSPTRDLLAAGAWDKTVKVWDLSGR